MTALLACALSAAPAWAADILSVLPAPADSLSEDSAPPDNPSADSVPGDSLSRGADPAGGAPSRFAGLSLGAFALQGPARHTLHPALGVWVSTTARPWGLTGELVATTRNHTNDTWSARTGLARASAVAELALGTRPMNFRLGAGLALSLTRGSLAWEDQQHAVTQLDAGLRVRTGLDGPLGARLGWSWQVSATSRGLTRWDYDTSLGLGVRW